MYQELTAREIKAAGWIKRFLCNQARGLTGNMGKIGKPFVTPYWEGGKDLRVSEEENFLGGLNCIDDAWTPFEQNGYWIDGMVRCARLTDDPALLALAQSKLYPVIGQADADGYIGPAFLKDGMTWAHTVYFRAMMAEYGASGDGRILSALHKHFLRVPLKERILHGGGQRIIDVRDIACIEIALWLYGETGDERLLHASEEAYEAFNRVYASDAHAGAGEKMCDVTVRGMLRGGKVNKNHGVTYCELCKLAAIMYQFTGKETYKKAAVNAFEKLYRDQMLIDGVNSSTEYLNGNGDSHAAHETCDISDLTWALGYLYMITGDAKYGDRAEDAVFNAGLGAVDDDFKGEQYFSCPNQVIADDTSNHALFFRGEDWMSYAPKKFLPCCAGNVHRFMPNFVLRSWMRCGDEFALFTYAPSVLTARVHGKRVRIEEQTDYPFENSVRLHIQTDDAVTFALRLRSPSWSKHTTVTLNGTPLALVFKNGSAVLRRRFQDGDEIAITFQDEIRCIANAGGVSVKKGALLYALPVAERMVVNGLRDMGEQNFPHYSLYAAGKWNYGLETPIDQAAFSCGAVGAEPWRGAQNGLSITLPARELPKWKLQKVKDAPARKFARGKCGSIGHPAVFTPRVKAFSKAEAGEASVIRLVPYGTTRLRIAIFPVIR